MEVTDWQQDHHLLATEEPSEILEEDSLKQPHKQHRMDLDLFRLRFHSDL